MDTTPLVAYIGDNPTMNHAELCDLLNGSPLAAELSGEQCAVLAQISTVRNLGDNEVLIEEGQSDNTLYVILHGKLAVTRDTGTGEWTTLHILHQGDMAGELGFVDGTPHSATLRAAGEAQVLELQRDHFESLLGERPELVYKVMKAIIRTVHTILRRMNAQYVELTNYIGKIHGRY